MQIARIERLRTQMHTKMRQPGAVASSVTDITYTVRNARVFRWHFHQ